MPWLDMARNHFNRIKVLSTVLITGALALEMGNLYAHWSGTELPPPLHPVMWIGRFAIAIHGIEGIMAAAYAPGRNKMPLQYGTYTFFVGTVALVELLNDEELK